MATHLQRHHPGVSLTGVKPKAAQQPLITAAFKQPLLPQSDRAKAITNAIFLFFLLIRKMIRSVTLIRGTIRTVSFLIRCTPSHMALAHPSALSSVYKNLSAPLSTQWPFMKQDNLSFRADIWTEQTAYRGGV